MRHYLCAFLYKSDEAKTKQWENVTLILSAKLTTYKISHMSRSLNDIQFNDI